MEEIIHMTRTFLYTQVWLMMTVGRAFADKSAWGDKMQNPWWETWWPFAKKIAVQCFALALVAGEYILYGMFATTILFIVWAAYIYNRDLRNPKKE